MNKRVINLFSFTNRFMQEKGILRYWKMQRFHDLVCAHKSFMDSLVDYYGGCCPDIVSFLEGVECRIVYINIKGVDVECRILLVHIGQHMALLFTIPAIPLI